MAIYRATMFLERGSAGWTETLYQDSQSTASEVLGELGALVPLRRAMLDPLAYVKFLRVSNINPPRDAAFRSILGNSGQGRLGQVEDAAQPDDAINVRLFAGPTNWRAYMLRGMNGEAFAGNGTVVAAGPFINALNAYFRAIVNGNWRIKTATKSDPRTVAAYGVVDNHMVSFTTSAPLNGGVAGAIVEIKGSSTVAGLNGTWRIKEVAAENIYLVHRKQRKTVGTIAGTEVQARILTPATADITDYEIVGVTSRKTGRPSYVPAGRRSQRRL